MRHAHTVTIPSLPDALTRYLEELRGYRVLPREEEVALAERLMLGDGKGASPHVTPGIGNVQSVAIATDGRGRDTGLLISHAPGQTILTFSQD